MRHIGLAAIAAIGMTVSGAAHAASVVAGNFPGAGDSPFQGYWTNESDGQNFLVGFSLAQTTNISGFRIIMGDGFGFLGDDVQIKIRNASSGAPAAVNLFSFADTIDESVAYAGATAVTSNFAAVTLAAGNYYIGMSSNTASGVWASYNTNTNDQWQLSGDTVSHSPNIGDLAYQVIGDAAGGVPEPATWAMMVGGFGFAGAAMRRRRNAVRVTFA